MKLTLAQITTITFALAEAAVKHQERADRAPGGTFWKEESDSASQLHDLFKDALTVTVESVHPPKAADACGDINCDGHCLPAAPHDPRPSLIRQIDACGSVNEARIAVANAPASALRRAARHLRTDLHGLPGEISRRVRARLLEQL